MQKQTLRLGSIGLLFVTPLLHAANLQITQLDFGNAANPTEGAPLPGDVRTAFFTLRNTGNEAMQDLVLRGTPGLCVDDLSPTLRIARLSAGQTLRIENPLNLALSASCRVRDTADLLLSGAYTAADGVRKPTWATKSFTISGPSVTFDQTQEPSLSIPDAGPTVELAFQVASAGTVSAIGVEVTATHSVWSEIEAKLIHPDGTTVTLFSRLSLGSGSQTVSFGALGTTQPTPALERFLNKPMGGTWRLTFRDTAAQDTGTVNRARLVLRP